MKLVSIFRVNGIPKAQPRTAPCLRGGRAGVYTPSAANAWKAEVASAALMAVGRIAGSCRVDMEFLMPRPKGLPRRIGEGRLPHALRPDADNLAKAVLDAMVRAFVLPDDAGVQELRIAKWVAAAGEPPGAIISVWSLEGEGDGHCRTCSGEGRVEVSSGIERLWATCPDCGGERRAR